MHSAKHFASYFHTIFCTKEVNAFYCQNGLHKYYSPHSGRLSRTERQCTQRSSDYRCPNGTCLGPQDYNWYLFCTTSTTGGGSFVGYFYWLYGWFLLLGTFCLSLCLTESVSVAAGTCYFLRLPQRDEKWSVCGLGILSRGLPGLPSKRRDGTREEMVI